MPEMSDIRVFLSAAGRDLHEFLATCTEGELYELNAESYAIYSAVFSEIKMRIAQDRLMCDHQDLYTNKWGYSEQMRVRVN